MTSGDVDNIRDAYETARQTLLAERSAEGFWTGELSPSALSTATAVSALALADRRGHAELVEAGVAWLAGHQNPDGGWGDTPDSPSNLATTMLGQAALVIADARDRHTQSCDRAEAYVCRHAGSSARERTAALEHLYGADRTFAVPILTNCALAGGLDWADIAPLPFELALVPHRWLRLLRAHVVSYALPALIAIGQLLHARRPSRHVLVRAIRSRAIAATLRKLEAIQPATGGFIEAVPLTSFVVMSLAAAGGADHAVAARGVEFLKRSARRDGGWPIDSNLSVWLTTLAVGALASGPGVPSEELEPTLQWIAAQQHTTVHPFTASPPGGWGWTHLAGGVPDADDTSGALLALHAAGDRWARRTAREGVHWLLGLQNRDGGWPTFCRGWGRLPFDRSAPDLTAHAMRALGAWADLLPARRLTRVLHRGFRYLAAAQGDDGSWIPLWFGNQHAPEGVNPVIGTARVLSAYRDLGRRDAPQATRGLALLVAAQGADGGWGGAGGIPSTLEETAVAVDALSGWLGRPDVRDACLAGCRYLAERIDRGAIDNPSPIGLYFTRLWYSERLYPLVWSVGALGRCLRHLPEGVSESGQSAPFLATEAI